MLTYRVKVRQITYVWGSERIADDVDLPLYLHLRVDENGEEAGIVIREEDGDTKELGILKPGECFTVRLKGFVGLYARCSQDTYIDCAILGPE